MLASLSTSVGAKDLSAVLHPRIALLLALLRCRGTTRRLVCRIGAVCLLLSFAGCRMITVAPLSLAPATSTIAARPDFDFELQLTEDPGLTRKVTEPSGQEGRRRGTRQGAGCVSRGAARHRSLRQRATSASRAAAALQSCGARASGDPGRDGVGAVGWLDPRRGVRTHRTGRDRDRARPRGEGLQGACTVQYAAVVAAAPDRLWCRCSRRRARCSRASTRSSPRSPPTAGSSRRNLTWHRDESRRGARCLPAAPRLPQPVGPACGTTVTCSASSSPACRSPSACRGWHKVGRSGSDASCRWRRPPRALRTPRDPCWSGAVEDRLWQCEASTGRCVESALVVGRHNGFAGHGDFVLFFDEHRSARRRLPGALQLTGRRRRRRRVRPIVVMNLRIVDGDLLDQDVRGDRQPVEPQRDPLVVAVAAGGLGRDQAPRRLRAVP